MTSIRLKFFFYWRIFAKFRPEKYDFNLFKGFFMWKMAQIRQILNFKNSKLLDFYNNLKKVAKNIEGFCFFSYLHIYYVAKFG